MARRAASREAHNEEGVMKRVEQAFQACVEESYLDVGFSP